MEIGTLKDELIKLNKLFHSRSLLSSNFYSQLMQKGFVYQNCILISIFPDGSNTYCGVIINQEGCVFDVDVDLDFPDYSVWRDITKEFKNSYNNAKKNVRSKSFQKEIIAFDLYKERSKEKKIVSVKF